MGGSTRSQSRTSYAATRHPAVNRSISQYAQPVKTEKASKKRIFISFHMEDEQQVKLLRSQAKNDRFDLEFIDYSIHEPFDEKWKTQCRERIARTSTVVVMIGKYTHMRPAVLWEIEEAYRQGKKVVGVRIYKNENHKIPKPMRRNYAKIVRWNMKEMKENIYHE